MTTTITPTKFSFYIPRVSCYYTIDDIIATFRLLYIGEVARVDINGKVNDYMSVFVHMDYLYDSEIAWNIVNCTYKKNSYYRLWVEEDTYWRLLKNNNPVEDTYLNIHQLAESNRILEEKVSKLEEKLEEKSETIARLHAVTLRLIYSVFPIKKSKSKDKDTHKDKHKHKNKDKHKHKHKTKHNKKNIKNIYDCVNMLHYGKFYNKDYLSADDSKRKHQLLEQEKEDLSELKWAEPWEDIGKHYEPFLSSTSSSSSSSFTFLHKDDKELNSSSECINSDDDTMPALISCYDSSIDTTDSSNSNNSNNSDKSERQTYTETLCGNN